MNTTRYYHATCGSLCRVTTHAGTRQQPASVRQARRSIHATTFNLEYPTAAEVARLVSLSSFTEVPAP